MIQCFKTKPGTEYAAAVARYFDDTPKWSGVFDSVGELLGEKITKMAVNPEELYIDLNEVKNPENRKLFTKDGKLKGNTKKAKEVGEEYRKIVYATGLSEFKDLGTIRFIYGVMRYHGEKLESFTDGEGMIYHKADFDLEKRSHGNVEPITEIEYEERYLETIKKKQPA